MTLTDSITVINAMPLTDAQKAAIIAQLVLSAPAPVVAAAPDVAAQQAANIASLAATRPDVVSTAHGAESAGAQALANTYVAVPPTANDRLNPPQWAYNNFLAAGYASPQQADGPVERWGSQMAQQGGLNSDWIAAFNVVVSGYAAGTANMSSPVAQGKSINAGTYTPADYTAEQQMAALYYSTAPSAKVGQWLDAQLGGDGVSMNLKFTSLLSMFGSSGSALLYNPYAQSVMLYMINGATVVQVKERIAAWASVETSQGSKDCMAQLDDAWIAQAQATIAQFK